MDGGSWFCTGGSDQKHPQEKERKNAKWLSEEALSIAEKRREEKGKGEKERYTHLNAEFQRIARRDKKVFVYYIIFSASVYVFDFHNKKLKNISKKKRKSSSVIAKKQR